MTHFLNEAQSIEKELIAWRRDFHQHPELRFEEVRTAGIVAAHLESLGLETWTGIARTGVVGILRGAKEGPVLMMRFDMDALAITEENDFAYQSQNPGVMHACGHDGHTAIGMGVASVLHAHREELSGTVMLIFQPAEEEGSGAKVMIEEGALNDPHPDMAFALHLHSQTPFGRIEIGDGPVLAAADSFRIHVNGRGGHGAEPQDTVDAILIASQIVVHLQTILSRNIYPLDMGVVSVGSLHAGTAYNAIAEKVEILVTIRSYDENTQAVIHRRVREVAEGTAKMMGGSAEVQIEKLLPATVNDPKIAAEVRGLAEKLLGPKAVSTDQQNTPSDDAAFFLQEAPGVYVGIGAGRPGDYPHHNPRFDFDEGAMKLGVALMCEICAHYLSG